MIEYIIHVSKKYQMGVLWCQTCLLSTFFEARGAQLLMLTFVNMRPGAVLTIINMRPERVKEPRSLIHIVCVSRLFQLKRGLHIDTSYIYRSEKHDKAMP